MKILLATFWVIPHVGGVWNYMQQLKKKLESFGHEVDLLGYGEDTNYVHIVNENRRSGFIKDKQSKQPHPSFYANSVVKHYENQRNGYEIGVAFLGLEKYDLIHTQDVLSTTCINRIRPKGIPLVATLHGSVAHELKDFVTNVQISPTSKLACEYFDELEYEGATSAEITIVANEWLKNILINEFHVPNEQIKILHYGYDIEGFLKRMKEKSPIQPPANKKVILYAGRLAELKGVHHLIFALSKLKKIRNDWVCWIVGDGPKFEELQTQSENLGLEKNIVFFGKRNDVPYLLTISDIFVLPSLLENQPLSVIEAQIAGKPVIVSDVGGLPEMVTHGVTGVLSPVNNPEVLSIKLSYLLEHDSYRENLGSNAKRWGMTHWSLDKEVSNVLDVYQSAALKKKNV
ncbi:glycosyltransferase family 4 protein [Rossellomorea yichunensis]|uniref:glycosyltransferase family 4 protein n=1 Tax=Rossellomorea yichunensis TaxID=3077331 RepID=UPI0028DF1108|nr:glycosyltransferase family 4 protein [Rossellomorea sp. YC4-1]MDT9027454.1 glycosyltransferase family 4 protein [Rossellomorea sp. YC4-1]